MLNRLICFIPLLLAVNVNTTPDTHGGLPGRQGDADSLSTIEQPSQNLSIPTDEAKGYLKEGTLYWGRRVPDDISSRVKVLPQVNFDDHIPKGNYSGITHLFGNYYAVVSDKMDNNEKGYYVFNIDINKKGKITNIRNCGYTRLPGKNEDEEAVAFNPNNKHIYIGDEEGSYIEEYDQATDSLIRRTQIEMYHDRGVHNLQIESLCYDPARQSIFTINEGPLKGDNGLMLRLLQLDGDLMLTHEYTYLLDAPLADPKDISGDYAHGVSELLSLGDGSLLALEREFFVAKAKIGSWVMNKVFRIFPGYQGKQFVAGWRTHMNLLEMNLANYEGMCEGPRLPDGRRVIILCADSQDRYKGFLKDYFRTLVIG